MYTHIYNSQHPKGLSRVLPPGLRLRGQLFLNFKTQEAFTVVKRLHQIRLGTKHHVTHTNLYGAHLSAYRK